MLKNMDLISLTLSLNSKTLDNLFKVLGWCEQIKEREIQTIPIPPINWVRDLQSKKDFGRISGFLTNENPVVVNPETDSKNEFIMDVDESDPNI